MGEKQKDNLRTVVAVTLATFVFGVILFISPDLSAESKLPKVKLSVKPLNLSRPPSTEELMAAGQLGASSIPSVTTIPVRKMTLISLWSCHSGMEQAQL